MKLCAFTVLIVGMVKKAASGVLAILLCSRTKGTLRAPKELRPFLREASGQDRTDFFDHSRSLLISISIWAFMCFVRETFNRLIVGIPSSEWNLPGYEKR
ncbi:MAG: hypothetical protein ABIP82_00710 [Nitrospirales bacterium]